MNEFTVQTFPSVDLGAVRVARVARCNKITSATREIILVGQVVALHPPPTTTIPQVMMLRTLLRRWIKLMYHYGVVLYRNPGSPTSHPWCRVQHTRRRGLRSC